MIHQLNPAGGTPALTVTPYTAALSDCLRASARESQQCVCILLDFLEDLAFFKKENNKKNKGSLAIYGFEKTKENNS